MRVRISLDTMTKVTDFVRAASGYSGNIYLTDADRSFVVSAKSMLGAVYTMEWREVWCECENDIYMLVNKFMIDESPRPE